jgi:nitrile hydratase subunit beta
MEGAHDLGGIGGFGDVRSDDGEVVTHEPWELRAQLLGLMACRGARAWIERIDTATYLTTPYYARWLLAAEMGAVARGLLTAGELSAWQQRIADGEVPPEVHDAALRGHVERFMTTPETMAPATNPTFSVGQTVRVRRTYSPDVHHRIPRYVRGVAGSVISVAGDERRAGHRDNDYEPVYTVRFSSLDVWGATTEPPFTLQVDLWQSYLEDAA